jgi:hypothetical protein
VGSGERERVGDRRREMDWGMGRNRLNIGYRGVIVEDCWSKCRRKVR